MIRKILFAKAFWIPLCIIGILYDIYLWVPIFGKIVRDRTVAQNVQVDSVLTYKDDDPNWDFCVLKTGDPDLSSQLHAGTPIPPQPLAFGISTPEIAATVVPSPTQPEAIIPTSAPTVVPTKIPEVPDNTLQVNVRVQEMGNGNPKNYHVVFVGVGYTPAENADAMEQLISRVSPKYTGVDVDFSYVTEPINFGMKHVQQIVDFENSNEYPLIWAKIRSVYPVDNIVFVVKTYEGVGTQDNLHGYVIVQGTDPDSHNYIVHEIGHMLGLGDGYQAVFRPDVIPNSELFYKDSMPKYLATALKELNVNPPLYKRGTCAGRELYSYYDPTHNIMVVDWDDASVFNPLQVQEMNDYIHGKLGK